MALTPQEKAFMNNFQTTFESFSADMGILSSLTTLYTSRAYSNISSSDLEAEAEVTATQLSDAVNFVTQMEAMMTSGSIVIGDYRGIVDRIRRL
jgi:hypothetical protein